MIIAFTKVKMLEDFYGNNFMITFAGYILKCNGNL